MKKGKVEEDPTPLTTTVSACSSQAKTRAAVASKTPRNVPLKVLPKAPSKSQKLRRSTKQSSKEEIITKIGRLWITVY